MCTSRLHETNFPPSLSSVLQSGFCVLIHTEWSPRFALICFPYGAHPPKKSVPLVGQGSVAPGDVNQGGGGKRAPETQEEKRDWSLYLNGPI